MKNKNKEIITVIDIGTSKICTLIAELKRDENNKFYFEIKGIGNSESDGMDKGVVCEIDKATSAIRNSILEAEEMAQITASNIYIGIAGAHIRSCNINSSISLSVNGQPREITEADIKHVIDEAKRAVGYQAEFANLKIIHTIPHYFNRDEDKGIQNPLKLEAHRLEARVHIVLANPININNIIRCVEISGYKVDFDHIVLEPIASGYAILNQDQRALGSMVIDIGGGTTDIAIFYMNSIRFTAVFPYGGFELTRRLSEILCTSYRTAENIKLTHGQATPDNIDEDTEIDVPDITGKGINHYNKRTLASDIQEEMTSLFRYIFSNISQKIIMDSLKAGIYITGGASQLKNLDSLISKISRMQATICTPDLSHFKGQVSTLEKPEFSTATGIFLYLLETRIKKGIQEESHINYEDGFWKKIGRFIKSWFV
ncbi:MAG: cell division protein FtsA [Candidatus Cloacimonetes bacterium]|nr:cell division protein FtsA [Candidatus Cloacimonadota bacterium]